MTKVTDDERLIEKSGYFREKWYLRNYPEAAGSGLAPARHYLQEGWKKGFRPSIVARGLADLYFKYTIKKEDYAFDDATEDYVAGRFAGPVRSLMEKGV